MGPKCLPPSNPYLYVISTFFFGFLLAVIMIPYSVPTKNLLAPASALNSMTLPPTTLSFPSTCSVNKRVSIGPFENCLVSHQNTLPSVLEVINSVPVFILNQDRCVIGSEWDFSTGDTKAGYELCLFTSQMATNPL